ncbi:MAG: hypothetical protein GYB51_13240 [Rhodobacteraceae bacterium]|nr:hypothetical protein [Paracoccaceae bacterium]
MKIDLGSLTDSRAQSISGHERGVHARVEFRLDDLDRLDEVVEVVVPDHVKAIATSFFQGMFSKSVQAFGSKDAFLKHYKFLAQPLVVEQILKGVERSLTRRNGSAFER